MTRSAQEPSAEGDVDALASALESPRLRERLAAAARLREHPGAKAEAALLRALDDDSRLVRQAALGSLVALDPDRDPDPVVEKARRRATDEDSLMVRMRPPGEPVGPSELVWLGLWRFRRLEPVATLLAALADESADAEAADLASPCRDGARARQARRSPFPRAFDARARRRACSGPGRGRRGTRFDRRFQCRRAAGCRAP